MKNEIIKYKGQLYQRVDANFTEKDKKEVLEVIKAIKENYHQTTQTFYKAHTYGAVMGAKKLLAEYKKVVNAFGKCIEIAREVEKEFSK